MSGIAWFLVAFFVFFVVFMCLSVALEARRSGETFREIVASVFQGWIH